MPIYEYRCTACGHELEKLQKMSDAPLTDCPACEQSTLVKKISAAGFRLKGGGWYETDFKKDGKRNLAGDGAGKDAPDASKDASTKSTSESSGSSAATSKPSGESGSGGKKPASEGGSGGKSSSNSAA